MDNRMIAVDTVKGEVYIATRAVDFKHTRKYLLASGYRVGFLISEIGVSIFEMKYDKELLGLISGEVETIQNHKQLLYGICSKNFLKQTEKSRKINEH